jgi:hypothetical protein
VLEVSSGEKRGSQRGDVIFLSGATPLAEQLDAVTEKLTSGAALEGSSDLGGIEQDAELSAVVSDAAPEASSEPDPAAREPGLPNSCAGA